MTKSSSIPLYLAPMAGAGDRAFRESCAAFGVDFFCTEMISSKATLFGDRKTALLAEIGPEERPCALQLFGSDPEGVARAAAILAERHRPDGIDLNFGCPVPKIAGNGDGSALMKTPQKCFEIVRECVMAVSVPVSVKIRAGWDEESLNAVEVALLCEKAGAARIAVHARCRSDFYRDGTVRPEICRAVKESVSVPVIANGDIRDAESAERMLELTRCDGLMIGRAAIGAPWVFAEIRAGLAGRAMPEIDKKAVIRRHLSLAFAYKPEAAGREMRMHMAHYLKGFRGAARYREAAGRAVTMQDYLTLIESLPDEK